MNATERQSQGAGIYREEAIQLPANGGSRAGSAWLLLRAWPFPLTAALSRRERGNVAARCELSTRPVSSQREGQFSESGGRQSGAAAESSPGVANPTKSNPIQPNPTRINV